MSFIGILRGETSLPKHLHLEWGLPWDLDWPPLYWYFKRPLRTGSSCMHLARQLKPTKWYGFALVIALFMLSFVLCYYCIIWLFCMFYKWTNQGCMELCIMKNVVNKEMFCHFKTCYLEEQRRIWHRPSLLK